MAKCLRCGAGNEWIQGEVKKEPASEALASYKSGEDLEEIERLKRIIERMWRSHDSNSRAATSAVENAWHQFQKQNNL